MPPIDPAGSHGDNTAMTLSPFGRETTFGTMAQQSGVFGLDGCAGLDMI
jgi:hypothetical protein